MSFVIRLSSVFLRTDPVAVHTGAVPVRRTNFLAETRVVSLDIDSIVFRLVVEVNMVVILAPPLAARFLDVSRSGLDVTC